MGLTKLIDLDLLDRFLTKVKALIPTKTSDITNDSGFITGMTILSYGSSTWQDFINAYNANKVVYCRASSNSNPASGSQTRLAFMAYVNNAETPTEVEFQYYRSIASHSDSQQGDQVYVYKLVSGGTWTATTRSTFTAIDVGTGLSKSYNNGTLTITDTPELPSVSSSDNDKVLTVVSGDWVASTPPAVPTATSDLTNDSGFITGLVVLSYGSSTWQDFINAYNANKVIYCRASSNSDPSIGDQKRLGVLSYVNDPVNPTSVEFQFYKRITPHTDAQQGDTVYTYSLTSHSTWTVSVNDTFTKIDVGDGLSKSYNNGVLELSSSWNKVWENANTGSTFGAQTLSLDLSSYSAVMITAGWKNDPVDAGGTSRVTVIGNRDRLSLMYLPASGSGHVYERNYDVNASGIVFQVNYDKQFNANNRSEYNDNNIPFRIYAR